MGRENSRWTYTAGSTPEGVIVYDDDTKLHSHHDTDPARGQHSAFDLVRLHRFGHLDAEAADAPITSRPSYLAMVEFANSLAEVRAGRAQGELEDLGPEPVVTSEVQVNANSTPGTDAESNKPSRFVVHSAVDFGSGPPMDWIVRGLLPRAELAVVYGESGSGKSFLALDLCGAISRGIEWRARRTVKGRVVYVCAEGSGGFKARLRAYARGHSVELAELPSVIADAPNLLNEKDAAALIHSIAGWAEGNGGVDVVVIDTLSATTPGGNENSGEDMGLVLSHCKLLHQRTGALAVLIHHSGKDATRGARGWSGLRAAADAEIEVTRNGDYRAATVTKMKDGTDGINLAFKLKVVDLGENSEGEPESSCIIEHVDTAPEASGAPRKQKPGGSREQILLDLLRLMAPSGTCNEEDLFKAYRAKVPKGEGRDQRVGHARVALTGLIAKKLAYKHGEDRVSLTSLVTSGGEQEWVNS
jgi:AAA domain